MPLDSPPHIPDDFHVSQLVQKKVIANPYPYYAALRDKPPQFGLLDYPPGTIPGIDQPSPAWAFLRHEDVCAIAKDFESFSSKDPMQEASSAPTLMLVNHDRPQHRVLRGLAQMAFSPRRIEHEVAPWASSTVQRMIDRLGGGEVDFMEDYAVELPARFMTRLIGTPEDDWPLLREWGNAFMVTSKFTPEERMQSNQSLAAYYTERVLERYASIANGQGIPDDLMSAFITSEFEGQRLTQDEVIRFCITLVVAGAETTVYFLGNLIGTLLEQPDLFDQLKADRTLVRPFMEESLRRDGPPQRLFRLATKDTQVGDADVKAGDWVALFYAAANRDPAVFEHPDAFMMNRKNMNQHLTFGHGIHACMGARVARMEADKLLNGMLDRFSAIAPGSKPPARQSGGLLNYGFEQLPIRLIE